ncbi:plasmodesmata-located protein 8-like isoform X2 [Impatiens glandulifera]|uniref:plasmodesmata-located protein 8-like isoform X2 n=1 Tax=Impatiens glandulifera TaxID=253017 RepID=UPI001FB18B36|nr:plasmodesmata-located protein 8-like isoform X2 [Impatiens glandulifera]
MKASNSITNKKLKSPNNKKIYYSSMPKPLFFIFIFIFYLLLPIIFNNNNYHYVKYVKASNNNNRYIYAACSSEPEKFEPNSPYESNLRNLLTSLVTSSSQSLYGSFSIANETSTDIYGLYQCRGDLRLRECLGCVENVASQVQLACPNAYGASLQFEECLIRYDKTNFLGMLDTELRYKKCGKSVGGGDPEFFKRRDDVLLDLTVSSGFRISKAGLVEGFAQCNGDLTASDCSVCLADAVQKIKTVCGSAEAADIFLGQCYARCWASGYYDSSPGFEFLYRFFGR